MIESNFDEVQAQTREVSGSPQTEEETFEVSLRPRTLEEFVGQEDLKQGLHIFINAAKKRGEPIDHTLLYGNPGLGKTTLAHIIANEMDGNIRITSGPALERVGDLAAILSNLQKGDILFIDEIHRMNRAIEEVLYPAMEDFALDLVVGKGPSARTLRLGLEKFTIIGATTRPSLLSSPLRDRFGSTYRLNFYNDEEMGSIVDRSAGILGVKTDNKTCQTIANRSRQTPRIANRLLKRVRDYSEVKHDGNLTSDIADAALDMLAIDPLGLDAVDRGILKVIIDKFNGGPVGLTTLAAATQEETASLEEIYEPFLLQLGFIERTPRGRIVTDKGYTHLDLQKPTDTLL